MGSRTDADRIPAEPGETVLPLLAEELAVSFKEEVHVKRVISTKRHHESVVLRHHEAVITHVPAETPATGEATETGERVQQSKQAASRSRGSHMSESS